MNMIDVFEIKNGNRVKGTFSSAEMQRRIDSLRTFMAGADIDAVLFTSMHNVNYYSDFLYCSFGRNFGLTVTQHQSTTISANIDFGQPSRRSFGENIVFTDWKQDNFFRAVKKLLNGTKRIGIEFDHITLQNRRKLEDTFPGAELVDISAQVMRMRMIKSPEEIALITIGANVADIGGQACADTIGEGVPEHEVALASTNAMVREIARRLPHGELRDTWTWFQSGINTDGAHNPVTSRRIQKGDILSLNCFPMIAGYYTALERTLFFGQPTKRERELWEINCSVYRKGLTLIKPGVRCCDIALELNEMYAEKGLLECRTFGYGHSFGVLSHYYGREAGLEIREDITTVLEPNMVVSMEPMITLPQGEDGAGGYREHDILVLTEDGADNITGFPVGPEYNIIPA